MSIGWVMFWKAVVLAIWAVAVERWQSAKEARREAGIELRFNKQTGLHEPYCPYSRAEKIGRRVLWIVGVPVAVACILLFLVVAANNRPEWGLTWFVI